MLLLLTHKPFINCMKYSFECSARAQQICLPKILHHQGCYGHDCPPRWNWGCQSQAHHWGWCLRFFYHYHKYLCTCASGKRTSNKSVQQRFEFPLCAGNSLSEVWRFLHTSLSWGHLTWYHPWVTMNGYKATWPRTWRSLRNLCSTLLLDVLLPLAQVHMYLQ